MNLLILDDDAGYAELVGKSVVTIFEAIEYATQWDAAIAAIEKGGVNVFWADLHIWPGDIPQSIGKIEELHAKYPSLVIVVSSGYLMPGMVERLEAVGVNYAMEKSAVFDPWQVASLIMFGVYRKTQETGHPVGRDLLPRATTNLENASPPWYQPAPSDLADGNADK